MSRYKIKISDSSGLSANVVYVRETASHKVEYYDHEKLVGENYFNTEVEATYSASHYINGEQNGSHFNIF